MDFEALVHTRKSVRGFKTKPVPRAAGRLTWRCLPSARRLAISSGI